MNSLPHCAILLAGRDGRAHFEGQSPAEGLGQKCQNYDTLFAIREEGSPRCAAVANSFLADSMTDMILYYYRTISAIAAWQVNALVDLPAHVSVRHLANLLPVNDVTHSALEEALRLR